MFGFFEQGAAEFVLIAALGLMVLGPKELPIVMRRVGQFVAKMRGMAAEFRASFEDIARQAELDELRKEVEAMRRGDFGAPSAISSSPPDPTYAYNPYDNAAAGLDNHGVDFASPSVSDQAPIMGEGLPAAEAEIPGKPRKPRVQKAATVPTVETLAETSKPTRKPRSKKADNAG